jgi:hypothetical protein
MRDALHVMSARRDRRVVNTPMPLSMPSYSTGADCIPPLELRTAYTVKGLGIGAGGLVGYLIFGPLGMILLGFTGWYIGNRVAIQAEKDFSRSG